jgi:hypothetical protein
MTKIRYAKEAIKSGDLDITGPDGNSVYMINPFLLNQHNAWENAQAIVDAHTLKMVIYQMMQEPGTDLKACALDLEELEYYLQDLWGFPRNNYYHKFWEYPGCTCPKMDNIDHYPNSQIRNLDCPVHGN